MFWYLVFDPIHEAVPKMIIKFLSDKSRSISFVLMRQLCVGSWRASGMGLETRPAMIRSLEFTALPTILHKGVFYNLVLVILSCPLFILYDQRHSLFFNVYEHISKYRITGK